MSKSDLQTQRRLDHHENGFVILENLFLIYENHFLMLENTDLCLQWLAISFVSFRFVSFLFVPFRFVRFYLFRFDLFRFGSICFVSFRSVSFLFVSFRSFLYVSFRFDLFRSVSFLFRLALYRDPKSNWRRPGTRTGTGRTGCHFGINLTLEIGVQVIYPLRFKRCHYLHSQCFLLRWT